MASMQHMQVIRFIGPNNWAVMVIGTLRPDTHRFREFARLKIIADEHRIGIALAILCGTRVTVIDNVKTTAQQDRLWPLPRVVKHIAFSIVAEFQWGGKRGSLVGRYTYRTDKDRDHCQSESSFNQNVILMVGRTGTKQAFQQCDWSDLFGSCLSAMLKIGTN